MRVEQEELAAVRPIAISLVSYHVDPTEAQRRVRAIATMAFGGFRVVRERLTPLADIWRAQLDVQTRPMDTTSSVATTSGRSRLRRS